MLEKRKINRGFKYSQGYLNMVAKDISKNKYVYIMAIPVILYYAIFHYKPMYGAIIAFKDFAPGLGVSGSPWVGFKHFTDFFTSLHFTRVIKNTMLISVYELIWGFPAPILLALLLNEIRVKLFKSTVQTLTYLPHFISLVVICGMIRDFSGSNGVINDIVTLFGGSRTALLQNPKMFRPVYIVSGIWQHIGWDSIIYLAALAGIDQEQYEAASIDGCGRFKQILHVTLPGIASTIIILLILRMGRMLNVGYEKIILLYNPATYETADVISSYVYRRGLLEFNWSFSTAVGLFNSIINFTLIIWTNKISRKVSETSLW